MTEIVTIASKVPQSLNIGGIIVIGMGRIPPGTLRDNELGGYVLTTNFPKELWDKWIAANRESTMVVNELIFADMDANVRGRLMPRAVGRPLQFGEIPYKG